MSYKSTRRQWVKLWVNEWLDGTTRFELTAPQRLLWIDLLALAGRSRFPGFIYAGEGEGGKRVGYPIAYLAGVLQMDEVTLNNALKLLQAHAHITLDEVSTDNWVIGIVNWEKYQSEYLRQKVYRRINPEKIAAKQMVNKAVKDGSLIKSGTCEKCGASGRIEGHHPDYSKPMEVVWLCPPCHRKVTTDCTSRLPVEVEEEGDVTTKTPLPPVATGDEVKFNYHGTPMAVYMGKRKRLPATQGGMMRPEDYAKFLTRKGFPARVVKS